VGLLAFAEPLVSVLYHYGAFRDSDVSQVAHALAGYGAGLLGLVAIKVLAPGFYANQDIRTPVRIAVGVLVITQLLNVVLVPRLGHAGLALSIGLGAMLNAMALLVGLVRRGMYRPRPGWWRFLLQVGGASLVLAAGLLWAAGAVDWIAMRAQPGSRIGLMAAILAGAAAAYFALLMITGVKLRQLFRK